MFLEISLILFIFSIFLQFVFILDFSRLISHKENVLDFCEGISVIICAKDEEQNLAENLPSILEQDYSNYEVIVVNDQSIDGTKYLLKDFEEKYQHLSVVTLMKKKWVESPGGTGISVEYLMNS